MPKQRTVPVEEARSLGKSRATNEQKEQYQQYIRDLTPRQGGVLELEPHERINTEMARLRAAAKALGVTIRISQDKKANQISYWLEGEPAKKA